jgi:hypothetical protein
MGGIGREAELFTAENRFNLRCVEILFGDQHAPGIDHLFETLAA